AARVHLAEVVRGDGARADLELRGGARVRRARNRRRRGGEGGVAATVGREPGFGVAAAVRRVAGGGRRADAAGNRRVPGARDANRDAKEAVAEPGTAGDGAYRGGA